MTISKIVETLFNSKAKKIIFSLLVLAIISFSGYWFLDHSGFVETFKLARKMQTQEATDKLVLEKLNEIILLPAETTPTIAIINDIDTLKNQENPFFANAKNGDRVIIYPDIAIIYDFDANKIINIGPVQMDQNAETAETKPETAN